MLYKLTIFSLLFIGELLTLLAEFYVVKNPAKWFIPTLVITLAGLPLILAYWLSSKYIPNTWVMAVISVGSIVLFEPLLLYYYLGQVPSTRIIIAAGLALCSLLLMISD